MKLVQTLLCALAAAGVCQGAAAADDLDALFDLDKPVDADAGGSGLRWSGYSEFGAAYTVNDPAHWSKLRGRFELAATGRLGTRAKFKLSGRAEADGAFDLEDDHFSGRVRRDQRGSFRVREAYVDLSAGDWEFRLGRQHVVWGEVVELFVADVVSARDVREFFLPEFETLRIPQWAARAEFFGGDTHLELLWIPVPGYDRVGKPGADFYPFPLPADAQVHEQLPRRSITEGNWGVRASRLVAGWDLSGFFYHSDDVSPTLYRVVPGPVPAFELRHDRIRQTGATMSKDFGEFVLKGEAVHTRGRSFNTSDPLAPFGLKASDTLDYVIGVDIPVRDVWRFNVQHYARVLDDNDSGFGLDRYESGLTLLVNRKLTNALDAEVFIASGLNRPDYLFRSKLVWSIAQNWRGQIGADVFGGRDKGLFGRFDSSDRVYMELRHWF